MCLKKIVTPLLALPLLFLFPSCEKERIDADGRQVTEVRKQVPFTHVHTSGSTPVFITYGTEYKVELEGSANLVSRYQAVVSGNEISLGYGDFRLGRDDLEIHVTLPLLAKVSLSGSAKIEIDGIFPNQSSLHADVSGSGAIELTGKMVVDRVNVNISGKGDVRFGNLSGRNAFLNISGNGNIINGVTDNLQAVISGSGNVYYTGNPHVEARLSGTGRVIRY